MLQQPTWADLSIASDGLGWRGAAQGGGTRQSAAARLESNVSPPHPPPSFPSTSAVELLYFHRALTVDHLVQCTDLDSSGRAGGIIDGNYRLRVATVELSVELFLTYEKLNPDCARKIEASSTKRQRPSSLFWTQSALCEQSVRCSMCSLR